MSISRALCAAALAALTITFVYDAASAAPPAKKPVAAPKPALSPAEQEAFRLAKSLTWAKLTDQQATLFAQTLASRNQPDRAPMRFKAAFYFVDGPLDDWELDDAFKYADTLLGLSDEQFARFQNALKYARASDKLDLEKDEAKAFAEKAAASDQPFLENFKRVFAEASDVLPFDRAYWLSFRAAERPASQLERYRWIIDQMEKKTDVISPTLDSKEFENYISEVVDLSDDQYRLFQDACLFARSREGMNARASLALSFAKRLSASDWERYARFKTALHLLSQTPIDGKKLGRYQSYKTAFAATENGIDVEEGLAKFTWALSVSGFATRDKYWKGYHLAEAVLPLDPNEFKAYRSAFAQLLRKGRDWDKAIAEALQQVTGVVPNPPANGADVASQTANSADPGGSDAPAAPQAGEDDDEDDGNAAPAPAAPARKPPVQQTYGGGFKYTKTVGLDIQQGIQLASQAFGIREKFLACTIQTESGFNPYSESAVGARGLTQLMPDVVTDIQKFLRMTADPSTKIGKDIQDLQKGWADYKAKQAQAGRKTPALPGKFKALTVNPVFSIGAGALWNRWYIMQFFGKAPASLSVEDLSMVSGAYNLGVYGLKKLCKPGQYAQCLATLKKSGITETYTHILKIRKCMGN